MTTKLIEAGNFQISHTNLRISLDPAHSSAELQFYPPDGGCPKIIIGINTSWEDVVASLLHETFELQSYYLQCTFERAGTLGGLSSRYHFLLDHTQMDELCCFQGQLIAKSLPTIGKLYNKHGKDAKKTK